ncbi:MAG: response regulator transcription factor [Bacteroidota bacterium]
MIDIIIADDHPILRKGMRTLLETDETIRIIGEAHDGESTLALLKHNKVDIVILDINMPNMDGIETAKAIARSHPRIRTIILSMRDDRDAILELLNYGIKGYLLKSKSSQELINAVKKVYDGGTYFNQEIMNIMTSAPAYRSRTKVNFTKREEEILTQLGECRSSKEISDKLNIAVPTVETHIRNIAEKLGVSSRLHLVRYAVENNYTEDAKDQDQSS